MNTEPVTIVSRLTRSFQGITVLDRLDLSIAPGEFVALLGRSGSGKSTLLRLLAGLDPVIEGRIEAPASRAVVFQEPRLLPWRRVWRNVALGLGRDGRGRALAALSEVGLAHRADAWPLTLSGGEAQRAGLARGLVREPALLLLDEPFSALDALTRLNMQHLVSTLWRRHRCSVLLVTHDVEEAILLADRIVLLAEGRIVESWNMDPKRPRRVTDPRFVALKAELLRALGADTQSDPSRALPPHWEAVRPAAVA